MIEFTAIAILAMFPLCMIFATFYDLFTMTIPNRITLALVIGFAIFAPLVGMTLETAAWHVGIAFIALVVGFALFSLGVMGGGDAKLIAASALWFGTAFTVPYLAIATLLGGVLTVAVIFGRRFALPENLARIPWISRLHDRKEGVPYGAALGPAAVYVFSATPWMDFIIKGTSFG